MINNITHTNIDSPVFKEPSVGTVLAFDFGEKRIGVAVGDLELGLAHPLVTIKEGATKNRFNVIAKLIEEWEPVQLVVGLPIHVDGTGHKLTHLSKRFARRLEGRFGINVKLVDERYTSITASMGLSEAGINCKKQRFIIDQVAAQQILQSYFDR
ncbi:MAG: Holliday junction resolvase RuvX [Nitrosomonadaceae bacterium]|nr:Holliday junction resolvase RuvX [Nitrosomonadaceae bacterium]|tara:strand:- start:602 stop:1066 length:465 start_codon:yes stop_codon:yes gene_type:complete